MVGLAGGNRARNVPCRFLPNEPERTAENAAGKIRAAAAIGSAVMIGAQLRIIALRIAQAMLVDNGCAG
jgi:hypothetical protein